MPKRSRAEKLATYSGAAKRGWRARKTFVAVNGVKKESPSTGEVEGLIGHSGGMTAGRALGNAGPRDAALKGLQENKSQRNAMVAQLGEPSTSFPQVMDIALRS